MGRIPIYTQRVPQRQAGNPVPSSDLGQSEIEMERRKGAIVGEGIASVGALVQEYAIKHKKADIRADDATFRQFAADRITVADSEAEQTSDPARIREIYQGAEDDINSFISGESEGAPNIRWKDHQQGLEESMADMNARIRSRAVGKALDANRRNTKAKGERIIGFGITEGSMDKVDAGLDVLKDGGVITAEERKNMRIDAEAKMAEHRMNMEVASTTSVIDGTMAAMKQGVISPGQAIDSLQGFEPTPGATETVRKRQMKQRDEAAKEASVDLLGILSEYDMDNTDGIAELPASEQAMVEAANKRLSELSPAKRTMFESSAYWAHVQKIRQYDPAKDGDGTGMRSLITESFKFGNYGDAARDRLLNRVRGIEGAAMGTEQREDLYNRVYALFNDRVDKDLRNRDARFSKDITVKGDDGKDATVSQAFLTMTGVVGRLADDLSYTEALQMLETHPVFTEIKRENDMSDYMDKLEDFDRPGQRWFGERFTARPF